MSKPVILENMADSLVEQPSETIVDGRNIIAVPATNTAGFFRLRRP